jgi:hypothetical protein
VPDLISAHWDTSRLFRNLDEIDKATGRASMWTVREAGRKVKQQAKRTAPVYRGTNGVTRKQVAAAPLVVNHNRPVKGLYKSSIHSSKRLKKIREGEYANRIAPRGLRVHLYTGKVEQKYRVMRNAEAAVRPLVPAIAAGAWARAMQKARI